VRILYQSSSRLIQGKEALARGDLTQALKDLSVSISFEPSIEAYLLRAEANYSSGKIEIALEDLGKAHDLCGLSPENHDWMSQIDLARNRYGGSAAQRHGPPVEETISAMLPTSLGDTGRVLKNIASRPELSTDGRTLTRKGGTAVYDLEIYDRNIDWCDNLIEMRKPQGLESRVAELIAGHSRFVHILAPNWEKLSRQTLRSTLQSNFSRRSSH
jgi:tetratricopeptide (TPR) repeat protein